MPRLLQTQKQTPNSQLISPTRFERGMFSMAGPVHLLVTHSQGASNQVAQRLMQSCPVRLPNPRGSPFGGTCHSCPVQVQPQLQVSQPNDKFEREADLVTERIMHSSEPGASEKTASLSNGPRIDYEYACIDCGDRSLHQFPSNQYEMQVPQGFGTKRSDFQDGSQPLPMAVRNFFEPRLGCKFSQVRVHTNPRAAELAQSVNARAFTLGKDVVFGPGEYDAQTSKGKRLIAHELVHVIQQDTHHVQALMRTCNCSSFSGGRRPTRDEEHTFGLPSEAPNLRRGDYCITGVATPTYNCYAWSIGITNRFLGDAEIDWRYGDGNRVLSYTDLERFYYAHGLMPVDYHNWADVIVYGNRWPLHAAKRTQETCGNDPMYESKLGEGLRIAHLAHQLEGGAYGNIQRAFSLSPLSRPRRPGYPSMIPSSDPRFPHSE